MGSPVTAADPDTGDVLAYSVAAVSNSPADTEHLVAFNEDFSVDAATGRVAVKVGAVIDFESRAGYVVSYRVSDNKDAAGDVDTVIDDTLVLTVTVTNLNEAGTVSISGSPTAGVTLTATVSDVDGSVVRAVVAVVECFESDRDLHGHRRREVGQLSGAGHRREPVPARDRRLHRRARIRQVREHHHHHAGIGEGPREPGRRAGRHGGGVELGRSQRRRHRGLPVPLPQHRRLRLEPRLDRRLRQQRHHHLVPGIGADQRTRLHFPGAPDVPHQRPGRPRMDRTNGQDDPGGPAETTSVPRGALAAPANLSADAGDKQVTLNWDDPADASISGYEVRYRPSRDSAWTLDWTAISPSGATTTTHVVTGLGNLTDYTFEVRAMRGTSSGPASSVEGTPEGPPDPALRTSHLYAHWTDGIDSVAQPPFGNENRLEPASCIGTYTFRVIWNLPSDQTAADDWQGRITTRLGVSDVQFAINEPRPDIPEMTGTVTIDNDNSVLSLQVRGRFGGTWGTWSPSVLLRCATTVDTSEVVLVTNTGETQENFLALSSWDFAQGFTTGTHTAGYTLTSIEVPLELSPHQGTDTAVPSVYPVSGTNAHTGTKTALTGPASLPADGTYSFTALANTTRSPSTEYWVLIEVASSGGDHVHVMIVDSGTMMRARPTTRVQRTDIGETRAYRRFSVLWLPKRRSLVARLR